MDFEKYTGIYEFNANTIEPLEFFHIDVYAHSYDEAYELAHLTIRKMRPNTKYELAWLSLYFGD